MAFCHPWGIFPHFRVELRSSIVPYMYKLISFEHPVLARIRLLGGCAIKEEVPTGALYVFVDSAASRLETQAIRRAIAEACPGRRVVTCVRARLAASAPRLLLDATPIARVAPTRVHDSRSA